MTYAQLTAVLANRLGWTKTQTKAAMDAFILEVQEQVHSGESVALPGLGKFALAERPAQRARMGHSPATGAEIKIPAKPATRVPKFRTAKCFKDLCATKSRSR